MKYQNILIIGMVWPEPQSSGAGTRMMQLLDLFQKQRCDITFASAAADSEFMFDLGSVGVRKMSIALNDNSFDGFLKAVAPNIVVFDRFVSEEQFGWRVAENCPDAIRILDTIDLHCLRIGRQHAFKNGEPFTKKYLFSDVAKREIASILRCDLSLLISDAEMELLKTDFKIDSALLHYLPFLVDPIEADDIRDWQPFSARKDFIFIGNFLHEPNWDAVTYLKDMLWPKISASLPDASLLVYGAYASQKVWQLHDPKAHFHIMGRAEDAAAVVKNARVVLAPVRFGAGAKGKLLEAMQCGTPSVTTAIGAEGMHSNLPWSGIVADDPDEIAHAAARLYTDEIFWEESQWNGISIINCRYAKALFEDDFANVISGLQENLPQLRLDNFMGSMLRHHTMASTKYLSRWIEAKNKTGSSS